MRLLISASTVPHRGKESEERLTADTCTQKTAEGMKAAEPHTDIKVSCCGTWQRWGFNRVATILSVIGRKSKAKDTETLSNRCDACAKYKHKKGVADFSSCHKTHADQKLCHKKTCSLSVGSMEPSGTETFFCRSVSEHGLHCRQY